MIAAAGWVVLGVIATIVVEVICGLILAGRGTTMLDEATDTAGDTGPLPQMTPAPANVITARRAIPCIRYPDGVSLAVTDMHGHAVIVQWPTATDAFNTASKLADKAWSVIPDNPAAVTPLFDGLAEHALDHARSRTIHGVDFTRRHGQDVN